MYESRIKNLELWIMNCELWTVNFELWIVNFELWIMNCELWTVNCELWIMNYETNELLTMEPMNHGCQSLNVHHITCINFDTQWKTCWRIIQQWSSSYYSVYLSFKSVNQPCNLVWENSSNTRLSYFFRRLKIFENNKNLAKVPLSFHYFLMFGTLMKRSNSCMNYYCTSKHRIPFGIP